MFQILTQMSSNVVKFEKLPNQAFSRLSQSTCRQQCKRWTIGLVLRNSQDASNAYSMLLQVAGLIEVLTLGSTSGMINLCPQCTQAQIDFIWFQRTATHTCSATRTTKNSPNTNWMSFRQPPRHLEKLEKAWELPTLHPKFFAYTLNYHMSQELTPCPFHATELAILASIPRRVKQEWKSGYSCSILSCKNIIVYAIIDILFYAILVIIGKKFNQRELMLSKYVTIDRIDTSHVQINRPRRSIQRRGEADRPWPTFRSKNRDQLQGV